MKRILTLLTLLMAAIACTSGDTDTTPHNSFVRVEGTDLITADGEKLFIRGTNLGNWLNPEGYMFGFDRVNSAHLIDEMLREAIGPAATDAFWTTFKDNYITEADIAFIASTGANTIRLPFHYKLFTDEDYMGRTASQDGFERIDSVVEWCRKYGMYVILDMHDAPGGQTGDNIDDSYGYPWLLECATSQRIYADIWRSIALRYKDEPVILGYDLLNEPIAPYFGEDVALLNSKLKALYRMGFDAIREVDKHHIVILGGAQWNSNFEPLEECNFDEQVIYSCHRYGGDPTPEAIASFIEFRDRVNRPMYMGEIGHNTYEWMASFCQTMRQNNIGYTFWPYKKIGHSSWVGFAEPENWESIKSFAQNERSSYQQIREAREAAGGQEALRTAIEALGEAIRFENCTVDYNYIRALGLNAE